jgi:hypothetical protein
MDRELQMDEFKDLLACGTCLACISGMCRGFVRVLSLWFNWASHVRLSMSFIRRAQPFAVQREDQEAQKHNGYQQRGRRPLSACWRGLTDKESSNRQWQGLRV